MPRIIRFLLALCMGLAILACQQATRQAPASRFAVVDGSTRTLHDLQGKVVLVTFWASSCSACVAEMPLLAQAQRQYQPRGYHTLAVAMQYDKLAYVQNFARSRQLPFDVAMDHDGQLAQDWQVRATPTLFILNRRGQIVQRHVGLVDANSLHATLNALLAEPPP